MADWKAKLHLKQHLSDDTSPEAISKIADIFATELRKLSDREAPIDSDDPEDDAWIRLRLYDQADYFDEVADEDPSVEFFNETLAELYNFCDRARIWIE